MARLDDIEDAVADAVTGGWAGQVDDLRSTLLALWSARGDYLTPTEVGALLARLTAPGPVDAAGLLVPAADVGNDRVSGTTVPHLSDTATAALAKTTEKPKAALEEARLRVRAVDLSTLPGVLSAIAPLTTSVSQMRAAASWAVHTAANEATVSAAAQVNAELVFVPERDACLQCIGHGGETPGPTPPLHPRCRCELHEYRDPAVPLALKRESVRSILRGFSLPSESEAARLRAARDLLRRGPQAPQSVKDYARRAVERGKFPRGRIVP